MSIYIKDIEELQNAGLPVDNDTDLDVIDRHFVDSENEFVKPVLGEVFFELVKVGLEAGIEDKWTTLLPYLQSPVAYNGYYRFYRIPGGQLNHRGFHRDQSEYSQAAPKWEIDQLKDSLICKADHSLDALIQYLYDNLSVYPEWKESSFYTTSVGSIIPSATFFNRYVHIGCSGRVFQKLGMYRKAAEKSLIRIICTPLYQRLINEVTGKDNIELTREIEDLLDYVRPLVAYETMFRGIKRMGFNYTDTGIYTYSYSDGTLTKTAISMNDAIKLEMGWKADWNEAREDLIQFLQQNIDDYPEYRDSDCYMTQPSTLVSRYDNDIYKKHFGL
jgi:hypothetical protein